MFRLAILGIAVVGVVVSLTLGFLMLVPWVVSSILVSVFIGIPSLVLAYLSQKEKKTGIKRLIVNKEIALDAESYETFTADLEENEHLIGDVSSGDVINVFLVNRYALSKFENQEAFSYEDCGGGERIKRTRIDFTPSKAGRWFLLIDNKADEETNVRVRLFVVK